jgi:hypothetical protein
MLGRLWSIARLTLIEAWRRKAFAILILFGAALLSSALFFPSVDLNGRLRLVESWALRASTLFAAVVSLFLAGFSLPSDFEQKRIYLLVTKPVSKPLIFLGRFVGYALLLAVFLAAMGLLTTLFLRAVQLASGPEFPPLVGYPRLDADAFEPVGAEEITGGGATHSVRASEEQALVWRFDGLRPAQFPERVRLQARFLFGSVNDPWRSAGRVRFRIEGPAGVHEETLELNTNEEQELLFPASILGEGGALRVAARAEDADGILAGQTGWVHLFRRGVLFERAMVRGMGLLLLQSLVVLSVTLMGSTFLSAPVSIILGVLLALIGSVHGYVRDGVRDIDRSLAEIKPGERRAKTSQDLDPWVLRTATAVSRGVLAVVPDFDHFDFAAWLLKDRLVSAADLGTAAARALPLIGTFLALGLLVMRSKDFG